jgi:diguanylate cyclase (GGDEF)-like protein/PAS domain S-box-containing protein
VGKLKWVRANKHPPFFGAKQLAGFTIIMTNPYSAHSLELSDHLLSKPYLPSERSADLIFLVGLDSQVQFIHLPGINAPQSPTNITAKTKLADFFQPDLLLKLKAQIEQTFQTALPHTVKESPSGHPIQLIPIKNQQESIIAVLGISRGEISEELYQSTQMLQLIMDTVPQRLFWLDTHLVFQGCSRLFALDAGLDNPLDIIGKTDFDMTWRDMAEIYQADDREVLSTGIAKLNYEEPQIHTDGSLLWLRTSKVPLRDRNGQIFGILGTNEDVTQAKRIEAKLQHRANELAALYKTSLEINTQVELSTVLKAIVERAAKLIGVPMGGIYLLNPDGNSLHLTVGYGIDPGDIGIDLKLGEGISGRAALIHAPVETSDYSRWEHRVSSFEGRPYRRVLGIPLEIDGKVIGVINLSDDQQVGSFSKDEIQLASMFADQAAIVINKARLLEAEKEKTRLLGRSNALIAALSQVAVRMGATLDPIQVMKTIGEELKKLGITIMIFLMDKNTRDLMYHYSSIDSGIVKEIEAQTGIRLASLRISPGNWSPRKLVSVKRPFFVNHPLRFFTMALSHLPPTQVQLIANKMGISSDIPVIFLPLSSHDELLGNMIIWGNDLEENDVPAFTVFGNQVAVGIENARLYNNIQRQAIMDDLTGLYNRRGFFTLAAQATKLAQRMKKDLSLVFVDVDDMKLINDSLGHACGDQVLIDTAVLLKNTFRSSDIIARMGGDEFAILGVTTDSVPQERLQEKMNLFNAQKQRPYTLNFSIGATEWKAVNGFANLDEMLSRADQQMYSHKREKKQEKKDGAVSPE